MKKLKMCLVILLSLTLLAGCWDATEIEDQFLVWAMGWDVATDRPDQLLLSMSSPTTNEDAPKPLAVVAATGYSLEEARNNIQRYIFRQIEFGHMRILLIGEEVARGGIIKYLDAIGRNPKIGRQTLIVVVDGRADELYQLQNPTIALPGDYMVNLIRLNSQNDNAVDSTFREFFESVSQEGQEPATAYVKMEENKTAFNSTGVAVFKGDKMVGALRGRGVQSYLLLRDLSKAGSFTIGKATEKDGQATTFRYHRHVTKIKTRILDGVPHVYVNIALEGDITEYTPDTSISNPQTIIRAEAAFEKVLRNELEKTVKQCQEEFNSDIFGFGMYFRAYHQDYWKSVTWDDEFPRMKTHITVDVKIRRVGIEG